MTQQTLTRRVCLGVCWSVFAILLATYWATAPDTVSYWDCPEYVSAAYLLEIGHPPGNPFWMLVEHMVTLLSGAEHAAYAVNLSSGVFSAFAGFFLAGIVFRLTLWILRVRKRDGVPEIWGAAGTAMVAALCFGWCDSTWYSAVEAEVYSMSLFFTALTVWLMVKWAFTRDRLAANRLLVLIAYIFGLSIGVHQLNLLAIPALALIWGVRRGVRNPWKLLLIVGLGMLVVGVVLVGVMPHTISLAAWLELFAVNTLGLPVLTGVMAFVVLLGVLLLCCLALTARKGLRRLNICFWMLSMLLTGYGAYALIPVRGAIPSPANPTMPGEPFSFARYLAREQYGGAPLLYGRTPYSKPMYQEEWDSRTNRPVYSRYALKKGHRIMIPYEAGARLDARMAGLAPEDSAANARVMASERPGYLVKGYSVKNIYTPELNCWFPRITSSDPRDLRSFRDWVGMDTATMDRVRVSEAFDTLGRPVSRIRSDGVRDTVYSYRPTVWQNLGMLGSYQIGYMYMRYLMWNFVGRQNDIPSQGEVQHGNFITGITPVDNLMLGAEDSLPREAGEGNPGRNRYYAIPFLLGLIGLGWLICSGNRARSVAAVTMLLFVMTGIAIVIYLNQSPGEPRERDYSFLGSFWTFSIWIGFGALAFARWMKTPWAYALTVIVPVWMCVENFDDHDRRGRNAATEIAVATLESLAPDAVIFVDGDNFTFPLWYAQEVLGVRQDVRVVNLSYMSLSRYSANLGGPWRKSPALKTVLGREDIIYDAFSRVRIARGVSDTLPAGEILKRLREGAPTGNMPEIEARYARMYVPGRDSVTVDMRGLSASGFGNDIRFANLMMFNILANIGDRPVYWMSSAPDHARLHLPDSLFTPALFGMRFGVYGDSVALADITNAVARVKAPNDLSRRVYMDVTPARMTGLMRVALIIAARRQMAAGKYTDAYHTLYKADITIGSHYASYPMVNDGDTVMNPRMELGRLQLELAPRLREPYRTEMRARGLMNQSAARRRLDAWTRYRKALPQRLRPTMAPVS